MFKSIDIDAQEVVRKAKKNADEWVENKGVKESQGDTRPNYNRIVRWEHPPQDWLKCNCDGVWPKNSNLCGIDGLSKIIKEK